MTNYGKKEAAEDLGTSAKDVSRHWHKAREDARRSGEIPGGGKSGCFVATVAYGTPLANEVVFLQEFRDRYLLKSGPGRALVFCYYRLGPTVAVMVNRSQILMNLTRCLTRLIIHCLKP